MIHANAIDRDQAKAGSAGAGYALAPLHGQRCQPASDHHEFKPGQLPSLMTGGRSRRGGCAARRQTGAQAGIIRAAYDPAIRPTRLGWCFTGRHDFLEIDRLTKAGVEGRVAAQLLTNHSGAQSQFQGMSERHVHLPSSLSKSSLRPDHHGRSEKGWRYQIQVMRYPK